jgi:hypothetical protein
MSDNTELLESLQAQLGRLNDAMPAINVLVADGTWPAVNAEAFRHLQFTLELQVAILENPEITPEELGVLIEARKDELQAILDATEDSDFARAIAANIAQLEDLIGQPADVVLQYAIEETVGLLNNQIVVDPASENIDGVAGFLYSGDYQGVSVDPDEFAFIGTGESVFLDNPLASGIDGITTTVGNDIYGRPSPEYQSLGDGIAYAYLDAGIVGPVTRDLFGERYGNPYSSQLGDAGARGVDDMATVRDDFSASSLLPVEDELEGAEVEAGGDDTEITLDAIQAAAIEVLSNKDVDLKSLIANLVSNPALSDAIDAINGLAIPELNGEQFIVGVFAELGYTIDETQAAAFINEHGEETIDELPAAISEFAAALEAEASPEKETPTSLNISFDDDSFEYKRPLTFPPQEAKVDNKAR